MKCIHRNSSFVVTAIVLGMILGNGVFAKTSGSIRQIDCKKDKQCFLKAAKTCSGARFLYSEKDSNEGVTVTQRQKLEIQKDNQTCAYRQTTESIQAILNKEGEKLFRDAGQSLKQIAETKRELANLSKSMPGMFISCQFLKTDDLVVALKDALYEKGAGSSLRCGINEASGTKQCVSEGKLAVAACTNGGSFAEYGDSVSLAKWKWGHDRNDEIVPHATRALKFAKTKEQKAAAHFWIGVGYYRMKNNKESKKNLEKAVELQPDYGAPHVTLGAIAFDGGKISEARKHAGRALTLDPSYAWAHNLMALVLSKEGKHDEAIVEFRKAIAIDPKQDAFTKNLDLEMQGK